jgi:D-alanyl-D-alanine carboxypeptidase (penicillin-binding protein 5/6)
MQSEEIRKIVNTKLHSCSIDTYFGKVTERRTVSWENTNKMLWRGWSGIKTGCTPNAGPCLAASYRHTEHGKDY